MNTETKREQPSPQKQPVPYNIGYLNPSTNPNTNHNSAISNTLGNPSGPISQNTYSAVPSTSSININAGIRFRKVSRPLDLISNRLRPKARIRQLHSATCRIP